MLVDTPSGKRGSAFDHAALASAMNAVPAQGAAAPVMSSQLPIDDLKFADEAGTITFVWRNRRWTWRQGDQAPTSTGAHDRAEVWSPT